MQPCTRELLRNVHSLPAQTEPAAGRGQGTLALGALRVDPRRRGSQARPTKGQCQETLATEARGGPTPGETNPNQTNQGPKAGDEK
eukprot:1899437-Lingulodinium_polyedra.AAC.1